MNLISFDELCSGTNLSRYLMKYYQSGGYFQPVRNPREPSRCYDERWIDFWWEARKYMDAGLSEPEALLEAKYDVFPDSDYD